MTYIRLRALFLFVVFFLNTAVGFACSAGLNMGFNNHHHEEEASSIDQQHSEAIHHEHGAGTHHHDENEGAKKGGCCNDGVIKFEHLDKDLNPAGVSFNYVPLFIAVFSPYFDIDIFSADSSVASQKRFIRYCYPPPRDIRVSIQSFQI